MQKVVYLSGLPTTGKSTMLNYLGSIFGQKYLFLPEFLEPFPQFVNERGERDEASRIRAQEWAINQHALKTKIAREDGRSTIMDRGVFDALAYSWAMSNEVFLQSLILVASQSWLEGTIILLDAPDSVIRDRLAQRDGVTADSWASYWQPYITKVREGYYQVEQTCGQFKVERINNTESLEEVKSKLSKLIEVEFRQDSRTDLEGYSLPRRSRK